MDSPNPASSNRLRFSWLILACINITVPILTIYKNRADETSFMIAIVSGTIIILAGNILALVAFHRRSQRDGEVLPNALFVGAGALAVVCFLSMIFGVSSSRHRNEYADLALSDTPLSSIEPDQKRLVVEFLRRTAANSQEENKAIADAQKVPMNPTFTLRNRLLPNRQFNPR